MARVKLTLGGRLVGAQRWSVGVNLDAADTPPLAADLSAFATQAFTDFNTAAWSTATSGATALRALASSSATLDQVRAYYYPDGSAVATRIGASTNSAVAGTGSITVPPQCSLVVSTLTGVAGRSNHGRMYLPCLSVSVGTTTGLMTAPTTAAVATSVANWLSLLRTRAIAGGAPLTPIVSSTTGLSYIITAVRCDDVIDTQRRRRDKVAASSTSSVNLIVG